MPTSLPLTMMSSSVPMARKLPRRSGAAKHEGLKGKVRFMGRMAAQVKGGEAAKTRRDGVVSVKNADEAVLYISIATNFA